MIVLLEIRLIIANYNRVFAYQVTIRAFYLEIINFPRVRSRSFGYAVNLNRAGCRLQLCPCFQVSHREPLARLRQKVMVLRHADAIAALKQDVVTRECALVLLNFLNFAKAVYAAVNLPLSNLRY